MYNDCYCDFTFLLIQTLHYEWRGINVSASMTEREADVWGVDLTIQDTRDYFYTPLYFYRTKSTQSVLEQNKQNRRESQMTEWLWNKPPIADFRLNQINSCYVAIFLYCFLLLLQSNYVPGHRTCWSGTEHQHESKLTPVMNDSSRMTQVTSNYENAKIESQVF